MLVRSYRTAFLNVTEGEMNVALGHGADSPNRDFSNYEYNRHFDLRNLTQRHSDPAYPENDTNHHLVLSMLNEYDSTRYGDSMSFYPKSFCKSYLDNSMLYDNSLAYLVQQT